MLHDLLDIALDPSKRGGSNKKLGAVTFDQIAIDPYCHDGVQIQSYIAVPQHGPLSLYIKFEGPWIAKIDFYFLWYGIWMIFKAPWIVMVTALWLCQGKHMENDEIQLIQP